MATFILQLSVMGIGDQVLASGVFDPARGPVGIGRDPSNGLYVACAHVSRFHASFALAEDGALQIADLGSFNGTRIGGRRLAPHVPHRIEHAYAQLYFGPLFTHVWYEPKLEGVVGGERTFTGLSALGDEAI